jgi:tetratricopeptide (TPR) repeat protein
VTFTVKAALNAQPYAVAAGSLAGWNNDVMTALLPRLKSMRRQMAALALVLLAASGPAHAEDRINGEVKVSTDKGFARLVFHLDEVVPARVSMNFPILVLAFKKPVDVSVDRLNESAPAYIDAARIDPDGRAIRIALKQQVKVHSIAAAEQLFVDLLPEPWTGVTPGLPQEVIEGLANRLREAERRLHRQRVAERNRKPPTIRVRVATQPTFTRYVFAVPEGTNVVPERHGDKLTLDFDRAIKWDLADALSVLPPTLSTITGHMDDESASVDFALKGAPKVRTFREDRSIAVDIGLQAAAPRHGAAEPADKKSERAAAGTPTIAAPKTVPADSEAGKGEAAKGEAAPSQQSAAEPSSKAPAMMQAKPAAERPAADKPAMAAPAAPAMQPMKKPAEAKAPAKAMPAAPAPAAPRNDKAAAAAHPPAPPPPKHAAAAKPEKAAPPSGPKPAAPMKLAASMAGEAKEAAAKPAASKPAAAKPAAPKPAASMAETEKPKPAAKAMAAPAATPAPDLNAPVAAELNRRGKTLRIEFPFAAPTPAAMFRRGRTMWLVFDSGAPVDLSALARAPDSGIREAHFTRAKDGAGIVRLKLAHARLMSAMTDGPAWIVTIADNVTAPTKPLTVARHIVGKNRASIVIPFAHPRTAHWLSDRALGAKLMVVTALGPVRGFLKAQRFVELRALPSVQGVVVEPFADDLTAKLSNDKIMIARPGGLSLSRIAVGQQRQETDFRALTFDTQLWGFDRHANFNSRQSELIRQAAMAPPPKRRKARFDLARFYLSRGLAAEAIGVIEVALADDQGADDITGSVLKGVADVMLDRPKSALKDLSGPRVGNQLDAPVWRALAYARQGKWAQAHDHFKDIESDLANLPIELQRLALRARLHADVEVSDFNDADRALNELNTLGVPPAMRPSVAVLAGRLKQGLGRNEDALANYRTAASSSDQRSAAQGKLREIMLRYAMGDMPRKEVIDNLETLTTVWRGDETEAEGLKLLAHLYTEDGRYREAFHVMKAATLAHPDSDLTRRIQDEAANTFEALFLGGKANALPPVEALGLFYDYRELTPIGRRGDEMIRKLADRLVSVDLLDQGAELLQHQVDHRLKGAARAQVATRLATIYLMNRKPKRALAALRATRTDGLSNELRDQRLLLEARALSEIGRHGLGLEMIANIEGPQAIRLRADILWAAKRWRKAAEQIELLHGERWKQAQPLSKSERTDVLRAAIGYTLGGDVIGLMRLRDKYAAKMADTDDRHAFEVVTAPAGTSGSDFKSIARMVAGADTLTTFLQEMRKRYPDSASASPNGADKNKAPAAAPAPKTDEKGSAAKSSANDRGAGKANSTVMKRPAGEPQTTGAIAR